jgi:hypothetical protein
LDSLPPDIGCDPVIRTRNKTSKLDDRTQSFHLSIDGSVIAGKYRLIHLALTPQLFAILLSPGGETGIPGPDLDKEHGINAVLEPGRNEFINFTVTIQGNNMDAMRTDQIGDALVMLPIMS